MHMNTLSLLALAGAAQAHMSMFYPPPLGGAPSINTQSTTTDKQFNYPLGCCGSTGTDTKASPGLCRGHIDKFDTEEASVTWQAGQDAHFQLTDYSYDPNAPGSTHSGGSCQVGFSTDKGATWKVAASYQGACPKHTEDGSPEAQTFDFKVPTGMPEGDALFAWVWLNREHEAFMNCAKVKIASGGSSTPSPSQSGTPSKAPSSSGTASKPSGTSPKPSGTSPKPSGTTHKPSGTTHKPSSKSVSLPRQSSSVPQVGGDEDETDSGSDSDEDEAPVSSHASRSTHRPRSSSTSSTSRARPTQVSNVDDGAETDNEDAHWWARAHKEVKLNSRKYDVDGHSCECRREPGNSRCYCDGEDNSAEKRAALEKKALRMHRRTLYKRVDACDWASAPAMEVSYYTPDAKCAPNAKVNTPTSDEFELSWDVSCGAVAGDGTYPIKQFSCDMYG